MLAVTQNIRQTGDIFLNSVKCTGEQLPEIMRKNFAFLYAPLPCTDLSSAPRYYCGSPGFPLRVTKIIPEAIPSFSA